MRSGSNSKWEHLTDEEIITAYRQKQDIELLGILYKPYMLMVFGVCMKYLKNREESQDAVMQIFEVLVRDVARFEIRNFKSWLFTVTKNYCLMQLRRTKKLRNRLPVETSQEFMESTAVLHPIEELENDDMASRLNICLEQLNNWQRTCIEMFYFKQKCYKEIAAELKMNENNVKSHIQNGKRNLKICMEKKEILKNV